MAKFVNSSESISSSLLLWNDRPTQVSIEETYDLKVWPVTNLFNDGPINFTLPPQPKGLLTDLHIVTKLKLQKDGEDFSIPQKNVSIINNLANSLWGEVSVICSDRTELCQSMKNAYACYSIVLEDCYILATYYRVRDEIHSLIEERLQKEPIPYFISRPEIIIRPVTQSSKIIRMSDVFSDTLPPYAFFTLQRSRDFDGRSNTNPFIFHGFKKFQFYRNGVPYFNDPLEVGTIDKLGDHNYVYSDFGEYFRQLYRTIGKDSKGNCLIDSTNFHLNFMVGMSFGADRSSLTERHLNLQEKASTYLEIDLGIEDIPEDLILIVYAVFDRQLQIDADRMVRIIE